jgi:hypothetical protein
MGFNNSFIKDIFHVCPETKLDIGSILTKYILCLSANNCTECGLKRALPLNTCNEEFTKYALNRYKEEFNK